MRDNDSIVPGSPGESTTVTNVVLDVADDGTLGDRSERQDVADDKVSLFATIDKLTGINTLSCDEELLLVLEPEGVAEGHPGKGCTTAGVVDDLCDHTLQVAVALAEVERPEASRTLPVVGVGLEDGSRSLTLCPNHTTHFEGVLCVLCVCVLGRTTTAVECGNE